MAWKALLVGADSGIRESDAKDTADDLLFGLARPFAHPRVSEYRGP